MTPQDNELFNKFIDDTMEARRDTVYRRARRKAIEERYHGQPPKVPQQEDFLLSPEGKELTERIVWSNDAYRSLLNVKKSMPELKKQFRRYYECIQQMNEEGLPLDAVKVANRAKKEAVRDMETFLDGQHLEQAVAGVETALSQQLTCAIRALLRSRRLSLQSFQQYRRSHDVRSSEQELQKRDIPKLLHYLRYPRESAMCGILGNEQSLIGYARRWIVRRNEVLRSLRGDEADVMNQVLMVKLSGMFREEKILQAVTAAFPEEQVLRLLKRNPYYHQIALEYEHDQRQGAVLQDNIVSAVPARYVDLYPATRQMMRHFILHAGPTNSGKTHDAMQALMRSGDGIYLGPLRLMAFEQYETFLAAGLPARLVTGEETEGDPKALLQASTIEMMNPQKRYACAVIDEAQMISDPERGGGWTAALMGLQAEEIHVCMAPHALPVVESIITACGDDYEVRYHHRMTQLQVEEKNFTFPGNVQDGDALIVFSRANVHAVASELQRKNMRCSIIYGALPYDVRHEEARKFREGETTILVSTDAIGMGMNLPVRRIVFLETMKFDGKVKRMLLPEEVQQIAGRAGRYGLFDTGYVTSDMDRKMIRKAVAAQIPEIRNAIISMPETLLGIDGRVSEIMEQWNAIAPEEGFVKADMSESLTLCREAEERTDDRLLVFRMSMIPFDIEKPELRGIWRDMLDAEVKGEPYRAEQAVIPMEGDLDALELSYHMCDLLYSYMRQMEHPAQMEQVAEMKKELSSKIIAILKNTRLAGRVCRVCGRQLSWNYPYGMCERCFRKMYR